MQRLFDIVISLAAILLLIPVFIPIIIILKLTGEGEVFFLQERVGKKRKIFKLCKFATMLKDSPQIGTGTVTLKNDFRVLPFGKFLRKTKLNELPQIINVLIGDMSIIGPRPQTLRCFNVFPETSQEKILTVRPGLSGIGSIIFRNEENIMSKQSDPISFYDNELMPYKGKLEEWYVNNKSLGLYLKLIFLTIAAIFNLKDGYSILKHNKIPLPNKSIGRWIN